ncbi:MAG: c-type cytochrome [Flavobacteriales bacterium]|nr:c-type cytochrome [Flavobacteriales bacterium]
MPLPSRISKNFIGLLHATLVVAFLLSTVAASAQDKDLYAKGEKLFKGNCASCHKPDVKMTGPALKGSKDRWAKSGGDIYAWVKNSTGYMASTGDAYAKALFAEYNKSPMTANAVSNEDIDAILYYADNYKPKVAPPPDGTTAGGGAKDPKQMGDDTPWQWLIIVVLLLLVVVLSLGGVKNQLKNALHERDGKEAVPERSIWGSIVHWSGNNKSWASIFGFILFCFLIVQGWNWAINIGIYGGEEVAHYKPEQPIKFNHTLHAGKMAINCQYCHSSAEKSKHAGIPSANVCMNCHQAIAQGPVTGTAEIAKIYEAVGWDPTNMKYTGVEKPIAWVKVHNLPDHVAFNHATHVAVGKIECQKCHGPVDTQMDVAEQWNSLTMGWCIQCHNETEVSQMASGAQSNGYYDEIHRRLTETPLGNKELQKYLEDEKITVKELGGWECAKCHY